METFLYLFVHYGLPLILMLYFVLRKYDSKIGLITTTSFSVSIIFFLYLWGQWPIVGSYYIRYLLIVVIVTFLYLFFIKNKSIISKKKIGLVMKIRIALTGLFSLFIIFSFAKIIFTNSNYDYDIEKKCPVSIGKCNHAFHYHCITTWVNQSSGSGFCPFD